MGGSLKIGSNQEGVPVEVNIAPKTVLYFLKLELSVFQILSIHLTNKVLSLNLMNLGDDNLLSAYTN